MELLKWIDGLGAGALRSVEAVLRGGVERERTSRMSVCLYISAARDVYFPSSFMPPSSVQPCCLKNTRARWFPLHAIICIHPIHIHIHNPPPPRQSVRCLT